MNKKKQQGTEWRGVVVVLLGAIMAAAEGGTISRLISANEGYSGSMYSRTNSVQYSMVEDAGYGSTNISAGEIEITANINATYEMVQG